MSACIIAIGAPNTYGYKRGTIQVGPIPFKGPAAKYEVGAHVMAYVTEHGPVPPGNMVCHTCDNPPCVNPLHLFLGDDKANVRDMVAKGRHYRQKQTHCQNGHEWTAENTYTHSTRGTRECRACHRERQKRRGRTK
jgi:hypothetical protein